MVIILAVVACCLSLNDHAHHREKNERIKRKNWVFFPGNFKEENYLRLGINNSSSTFFSFLFPVASLGHEFFFFPLKNSFFPVSSSS